MSDEQGPIIPRSLKSADPDLEVTVGHGDQKRTYRYHGVILASYSEYIDAILANPMREQETRIITFPDIAPEAWEKIMAMHEIGGYRALTDTSTIADLLPILDEYQFCDAISTIDGFLHDYFSKINNDNVILTRGALLEVVDLAALSCNLNLARSKTEAIKLAVKKLKGVPTSLDEDHVRTLLSLVQDEDEVLRFIVAAATGKKNVGSSIDDIRTIIAEDGFAARYKIRSMQIEEQEEVLSHLQVKFFIIETSGLHFLVGRYSNAASGDDDNKTGAMKSFFYRSYEADDGTRRRVVVEAMDPFGEEWRISDVLSDEEDVAFSNMESRRSEVNILYKWESGFGSLLPPRYGWCTTEQGEDPVPTLDYSIKAGRGY